MKTIKVGSLFLSVALSLALVTMSGDASAAGAGLDPNDLPVKVRTELRAEIDKARAETPELFKTVQEIAARAKEIDGAARKPGIPFTMHFKPLGNRALYPMLELLVFDSHTAKDLPPTAASALRLGLIEAIGSIRDERAIPVLTRILEIGRDDATVRASAEALSRIGTDQAMNAVLEAATKARAPEGSNDRERAVLSAMHDLRREAAARFLVRRLKDKVDAETARVILKSLGGVGNAWVWKTMSDRREEAATRSYVAAALVDAFVRFDRELREAAAKALLVVDDPSTPSLIEQAKKHAQGDVVAELDKLDKRFANNPSRQR
jgi:HEAT repeat protein